MSNKNITDNQRLFKSLFLVPQKWQLDNIAKLDDEMLYVSNREAALRSKESNRLVKRGESPTPDFLHIAQQKHQNAIVDGQVIELLARRKKRFEGNLYTCPEPLSLASRKTISLNSFLATQKHQQSIQKDTKTCVRMFTQGWSNKYKFNLITGALGAKVAPPETGGERITKELTKNASRKILESGAYLSTTRAGYTTFLTLTFSDKSRQDLQQLKAVNKNTFKWYRPTAKQSFTAYKIQCFQGAPLSLGDTDKVSDVIQYSNCIEAMGAFSPVTFEPKTTIGKEVSRFFDGAQKIYQRGFVPKSITETREYPWGSVKCQQPNDELIKPAYVMYCPDVVSKKSSSGEFLDFENAVDFEKYNPRKHVESEYLESNACFGEREKAAPLDYMWVAEQPANDKGEKNPHVHILMRWQVKPELFQAWAQRLESLWGHGFAKLERIKTPQAASNYLLKAVGYLTKGSSGEQGDILGNRYGISASARAPKWECIGEFYADNFLAILGELREKLNRKKARSRALINAKINSQAECKKQAAIMKNQNKKSYSEKREAYISAIKKQLSSDDNHVKIEQQYINELPFINDFSIGGMSEEQATNFLNFAMRERFWGADIKENRFSKWSELKENTVKALKENRAYYRHLQHLLETEELTWQWAENNSNFLPVTNNENLMIDEFGNHWQQTA
jgi:hypothetical protein